MAEDDGNDGNNGNNGSAGNWRDTLPDEIKGSEALANFEDVSALAKGFIDVKSYQGASIKIPGEDAGEADVKAFNDKLMEKVPTLMRKPDLETQDQSVDFYRSLGMPEKSDGYEIPEVKIPDGVEIQTGKAESFREIAHKHGLTANQFKGVMKDVIEADIVSAQAGNEDTAANMTAIKEKFGHAFSDNMGKINTLLTKTGAPTDLVEAVKSGMVGLETVTWMYNMGKQMGGEGFNFDDVDDTTTREHKMTPEEAQGAIDEINNNKDHAYWKGTGEEKKRATDRMIQLMKFANPNASVEMARA